MIVDPAVLPTTSIAIPGPPSRAASGAGRRARFRLLLEGFVEPVAEHSAERIIVHVAVSDGVAGIIGRRGIFLLILLLLVLRARVLRVGARWLHPDPLLG